MAEHDLKTWPSQWEAIECGKKRHEIRACDDRDFAAGDVLVLRKWDPHARFIPSGPRGCYLRPDGMTTEQKHSAATLRVRVTYITYQGCWGLPEGLCVMSIALGDALPKEPSDG